jgi:hypothetical protein
MKNVHVTIGVSFFASSATEFFTDAVPFVSSLSVISAEM